MYHQTGDRGEHALLWGDEVFKTGSPVNILWANSVTSVYTREQMESVEISHRKAKTWYAIFSFHQHIQDTRADARKVGLDSCVSNSDASLVHGSLDRV